MSRQAKDRSDHRESGYLGGWGAGVGEDETVVVEDGRVRVGVER